jgi:hypothetical protein
MARHVVDVSKHSGPQGMTVTKAHTSHRSLADMPPSRGSALADVSVKPNNATPKPSTAGVPRAAVRHPAWEDHPVPSSSQYVPPPVRVVAAEPQRLRRRPG